MTGSTISLLSRLIQRRTIISTVNKLAQKLRQTRSIQAHTFRAKDHQGIDTEKTSQFVNIPQAIYSRPPTIKIIALSLVTMFCSTNIVSGYVLPEQDEEQIVYVDETQMGSYQPTGLTGDGMLVKPALIATDTQRVGINDVLQYTVRSGDTLSSLADRFGIKADTIVAVNNLSTRSVRKGQKLEILPVDGLTYTFQKDDTLDKVAQKYNVAIQVIRDQNKLKNDTIARNTTLIIPGAKPIVVAPVIITKTNEKNVKRINTTVASILFTPGVKKVIAPVGMSEDVAISMDFAWPVAGGGRIAQKFTYGHPALDITYDSGNMHPSIIAVADGVVVQAEYSGWNGGYGNVIVIDHWNGVKTRYAHNDDVYVAVGEHVKRGQVIGKMGNTGNVRGKTGIHSHFEFIVDGKRHNPLAYL